MSVTFELARNESGLNPDASHAINCNQCIFVNVIASNCNQCNYVTIHCQAAGEVLELIFTAIPRARVRITVTITPLKYTIYFPFRFSCTMQINLVCLIAPSGTC